MTAMQAVGVIPARFAASRFPGKPLATIAGRPMIQHVFEGARQAASLRDVLVATDDERVAEACRGFGAPVVMTSPDHPTGSDRLAEVAADLDAEIIVNVQGDEPLIEGFVIDAAVAALRDSPESPMSTVVHLADPAIRDDPNVVKVVMDRNGRALYFSRAGIPHPRAGGKPARVWQHVGLYAYRRDFLLRYVELPPTEAEGAEALEQLRVLEHGYRICCACIEGWHSVGVDTPEDIARVEARLLERRERGERS